MEIQKYRRHSRVTILFQMNVAVRCSYCGQATVLGCVDTMSYTATSETSPAAWVSDHFRFLRPKWKVPRAAALLDSPRPETLKPRSNETGLQAPIQLLFPTVPEVPNGTKSPTPQLPGRLNKSGALSCLCELEPKANPEPRRNETLIYFLS